MICKLSICLVLAVLVAKSFQRCPTSVQGFSDNSLANSRSCSFTDPEQSCFSVQWIEDENLARCFDVVTIYYNGDGACCDGYDYKTIYPKYGDDEKGPTQGFINQDTFFHVDICRLRTSVHILYVVYDAMYSVVMDSLVSVSLDSDQLENIPCNDECHEAVSQERLEQVSGPCPDDSCYEYELRWREAIMDIDNYQLCFNEVNFYYVGNQDCVNGKDCMKKGYRKETRNPRTGVAPVRSPEICGKMNKAFVEFISTKNPRSSEDTIRSWVSLDLDNKITPCKKQCYQTVNEYYKYVVYWNPGRSIVGRSSQCKTGDPQRYPGCYEKHGLTSYFEVDVQEGWKIYALDTDLTYGDRYYADRDWHDMVHPVRCWDKITLFYGGNPWKGDPRFPPDDKGYKVQFWDYIGKYEQSFDGKYPSVEEDPTYKSVVIYPRLTGEGRFQVPGICGEFQRVWIKHENKFLHEVGGNLNSNPNRFFLSLDFDADHLRYKIQKICLPSLDTVEQFARMGQGLVTNRTSPEKPTAESTLPSWAIAVILAALALVNLAIIILIYCIVRKSKSRKHSEEQHIEKNASLVDNPIVEMISDLKQEF